MSLTRLTTPTSLTLTRRDILNEWCVYEHHLHDPATGVPTVIYIGACHIRDVYSLADACKLKDWTDRVADGSHLTVRIIATGSRSDCRADAQRYARSLTPIPVCNAVVRPLLGTKRVKCINNDVIYDTQLEAATALGINQGALSLHLSGRTSHVKGFQFKYTDGSI